MEHVRRFRVLAPLAAIVVLGAVGVTRPAALRAGDPPWDPPPCAPGSPPAGPMSGGAWFALDADLDAAGWLDGQRLTLGDLDGRVVRRLDLPPESFASGPVGGRVLVGDDDGRRSRLRLVDIAAGCTVEIGREASVVRSAIQSPDGPVAWEHRVNRATRADEGVWQRPLDGGPSVRVLPGLPGDGRFGPTFATELASTADGRLVVASCGELRCRVRVLDTRTGRATQVDGTGRPVGVDGDRLIAYAACHGYPCRIETHELDSGRRTTLVGAAGPASLGGPGDRVLVYESVPGTLALLDLRTMRTRDVRDGGVEPVARGSGATSGASVRPETVLLAPAGHVTGPGTARRLDVSTRDVRPLEEVEP